MKGFWEICGLLSLLSTVSGVTVHLSVVSACPRNTTDLSLVKGIRDARACSVECALRPNCTAVFKRDDACYLANLTQYEALWTPQDCVSEVAIERLNATTSQRPTEPTSESALTTNSGVYTASTPGVTTSASTTAGSTTSASTTAGSTTSASTTPGTTKSASTTPGVTPSASTTPGSITSASTTAGSITSASTTPGSTTSASTTPVVTTSASTTPGVTTSASTTPGVTSASTTAKATRNTTPHYVCYTANQPCTTDFVRDCSSDVHYLRCNYGTYIKMSCSPGTSWSAGNCP